MKNNNFNVKHKFNKKMILEEESRKERLLSLLNKNRKSIIMSIVMLLFCLILISVGIAFSLFEGSNDYDIVYITGSEQIGTNTDPDIDDEEVEDELLGEIAREDGVVVLVESVMTSKGEIISYYTDGTAVMINAKGKIYRISTNASGKYGVDKNGKVDETAKKVLVTSTTSTLSDGSIITYYSDGTAKVELNDKSIFVRDSNNIKFGDGNVFDNVNPSGVALSKEVTSINNGVVNQFSDGTVLIKKGKNLIVVNKNGLVDIEGDNVTFNKHNAFSSIGEKSYSDGNIITHFSNGSAIVTDKKGNAFYVKSSADLLMKDKKLYEIIPSDRGNSMGVKKPSNGGNVIYYSNGAAVVVYRNNERKYVEISDDIVFDDNNNINDDFSYSKLTSTMVTTDGKKVYSFENGKSQVIESNNSSYIVDTDTLDLRPIVDEEVPDDNVVEKPEEEKPEVDDKDEGIEIPEVDPGEGIYISDAEHEYDDPLDVQSSVFLIKNDSTTNKNIRIVIEEVDDYKKYETSRLEPKFVKFQSTVGDYYVPATHLADNRWVDEDGATNYVIYDGVLKAKSTVTVAISLYVDYSLLNNSHQNKGFRGTIKVYVEG